MTETFALQRAQAELIRSQPGGNVSSSTSTSPPVGLGSETGKGLCIRCQRPSTLRCSRCKAVRYCTRECQAADWKAGHKNVCRTSSATSTPAGSPLKKKRPSLSSSPSKRDVKAAAGGGTGGDGENEILAKPKHIIFPFKELEKLYRGSCNDWGAGDTVGTIEEIGDDSFSCLSGPVGLRNVGNSCFANSVMQCLLHIEPFATFFLKALSHEDTGECSKAGEWCPLCETEDLVQSYYGSEKKVYSPRSFLVNIEEIGKHFSFGDQEDAHDFMVEWLDSIQVVMAKEAARACNKKKLGQRSEETSLIWQIFGGHTRGEVRCDCGFVSKTFQGFLTLELQIPHGIRSLERALKAYTQTEELCGDNQYSCDSCKQRRDAEVSSMIEIGPNVLMIALKRFSYYGFGKITTQISFPETLDLKPYMAKDAADLEDLEYSLYAVIVHISPFSTAGHYISFIRRGTQWYKCDDSSITPVSARTVLSQNVYMLLYQRDVIKDHTTKGTDPAKSTEKRKIQDPAEREASDVSSTCALEGPSQTTDTSASSNGIHLNHSGKEKEEDTESNTSGTRVEAPLAKDQATASTSDAEGRDSRKLGDAAEKAVDEGDQKPAKASSAAPAQNQEGEGGRKAGAPAPEYTIETIETSKGNKRLKLHISLPAVDSQKEIDLRLSKKQVILIVDGKYDLNLEVNLRVSQPVKCRFVKKTKTLKLLLDI